MKTSMNFLLIPAFAALAVSCSHDEALQPEKKQPVVVQASTEYTEAPATRTIFGTPTSGDDGKSYSIPLTWNYLNPTNEKVDVVSFNGDGDIMNGLTTFDGVAGSLTNENKSMRFTGTYPTGTNDMCAYLYPTGYFQVGMNYETMKLAILPQTDFTTTQIQTGNDNREHLTGVNWMYSDRVAEGAPFTLKPIGAILRFDLTFPSEVTGGTIMLASQTGSPFHTQLKVSFSGDGTASIVYVEDDMTNYQSLDISGITPATKEVVGYMMVPPTLTSLQNINLALIATMKEGTFIKILGTTTSTAKFEPGKCYNFVVPNNWDMMQ
jgi:hypothetical protein